jgi:adenylate kinase
VPDELVIEILKARINQEDVTEKGFLLDGFPRTGEQAKFLIRENLLPQVVVSLHVTDEEIIERVTGRRLDPVNKQPNKGNQQDLPCKV